MMQREPYLTHTSPPPARRAGPGETWEAHLTCPSLHLCTQEGLGLRLPRASIAGYIKEEGHDPVGCQISLVTCKQQQKKQNEKVYLKYEGQVIFCEPFWGENVCLSLDAGWEHEADFVQSVRKPALVRDGTFVYVSGGGTLETAGECSCVCALKVLRSP